MRFERQQMRKLYGIAAKAQANNNIAKGFYRSRGANSLLPARGFKAADDWLQLLLGL